MGNPYPADFLEPDGSVRLGGAIDFTDQNNQPGGGSNPVNRGEYVVSNFTVSADGSFTQIPWVSSGFFGADPLDLTDPLNPVAKVDGVYAITVTINATVDLTGPPADPYVIGLLEVDPDEFDWSSEMKVPPTAAGGNAVIVLPLTIWVAAGQALKLSVGTNGGAAGTVSLTANVQLVTQT